MDVIKQIFQAYDEGYSAIFLKGRSLYDLDVDSGSKIRPILEILRRYCLDQYGMICISYCLARGLDWDASQITDKRDRNTVRQVLKVYHLKDIPQDHNEVIRVFRGISSLSRTPPNELKWSNGSDLHFLFLFEFSEHIMPGSLVNGTQTDQQLLATELAHLTTQSLALRSSGNFIIFHGRDGMVDELVSNDIYHMRMKQPDLKEKKEFLKVALSIYNSASFEARLSDDGIAHMTTNTPNRSLESHLRSSHRTGKKITANELSEQKNHDVEALSENTLTVLDTNPAKNLNLCGVNIEIPSKISEQYAKGLAKGDRSLPANVIFVGPPGSGKTDLAILTAYMAKLSAYQMLSPKGGIVGETERKARLQQTVLREWSSNVAFIDEITEAFPLERTDFDGDSGASRAVMAALLTALSDETRRGKSLLIATTNCPWRMGAAMRSRFTIIPVLHPLKNDYPQIIVSIAKHIKSDIELDDKDPKIVEAANIFYEKGANPRHIRSSLNKVLQESEKFTANTIIFAADDLCHSTDFDSVIYTDLWAIKACSFKSFLPWNNNLEKYQFPSHLKEIVNPDTGEINDQELNRQINEMKSYANV